MSTRQLHLNSSSVYKLKFTFECRRGLREGSLFERAIYAWRSLEPRSAASAVSKPGPSSLIVKSGRQPVLKSTQRWRYLDAIVWIIQQYNNARHLVLFCIENSSPVCLQVIPSLCQSSQFQKWNLLLIWSQSTSTPTSLTSAVLSISVFTKHGKGKWESLHHHCYSLGYS